MVLRGQIGWGSYLGRIMFDILYHYQLPPSSFPLLQESYLSLADVPLSVMNFLYPPTSSPPHLSTSPAAPEEEREELKKKEKKKRRKKREVIDVPCHCKQNGKYNLAFSLCGDNGANTRRQHGLKQTAGLVIRQECFGAMWRAG